MTLRSMWVLTGSNSRHNRVAYFGRSNKRLRDGISLDEKSTTKEKEKNRRKRLRLANNDTPSISPCDCMKEAKKYLHRSQDPENPHKHKSIVCVICD